MSGHYLGGMHSAAHRPMRLRQRSSFRPFAAAGTRHDHRDHRDVRAVLGAERRPLDPRDIALPPPCDRRRGRSAATHAGRALRARGRCSCDAAARADPATTATLLARERQSLINGGVAPDVNGDDDATALPAATGLARRQLRQEQKLANDLTATGAPGWRAGRSIGFGSRAREKIATRDPVRRLGVLAALTSNVSLNAARTIADGADRGISKLILTQVMLGIAGLLAAFLLAAAHERGGAAPDGAFPQPRLRLDRPRARVRRGRLPLRQPVGRALARRAESELLTERLRGGRAPGRSRAASRARASVASPSEIVFRIRNHLGEWRHIEAQVTDMRGEQHVRGVVLNARDISERVVLEEELRRQAFHDSLTGLANRALFRDRLDHALARSPALARSHSRCCSSTSTGSSRSTTTSATTSAISCCCRSPRASRPPRAPSDTVARFGGDEFAVLVEGGSERSPPRLADRLLDCLSRPATVADRTLAFGASIGIATHVGRGHGRAARN